MERFASSLSESVRRELEALEAEHWSRRKRELGAWEGIRVAAELRAHLRDLRPEWPGPEERSEDLAVHARVGAELRRVRSTG